MIRSIKYKDFYLNQKYIPKETDENYEQFWETEKERCQDGIKIDGVYFPGKLYWHLNYWHVDLDYKDEMGRIQQSYMRPPLRDIEWVMFGELEKAETGVGHGKQGLVIGGCRRLSKSFFISSYLGHGITFDEGSQNVLVGLNSDDIKVTAAKLKKGLKYLPKEWRWHEVNKDWKKQVDFGIKEKLGDDYIFSSLLLRNLDGGVNTEAIAGLKPRKLVIEEIGKGSHLKGLQAATPSFSTPYGWTCSPICIFTGGDVEKGKDAKELFFSPEAFNFRSYIDPKTGRKTGLFLGNDWRMDAKVETTLDKYLGIEGKELAKIKIQVSDPVLAKKILDETLEKKKQSSDRSAYYKEKMYYPETVDDIFLNSFQSIYDINLAKAQLSTLKVRQIQGTCVELYQDVDGIVRHKLSDKRPIGNFPVKPEDDLDAPVVVYEFPKEGTEYGLYSLGIDPYRQGQAAYSTSLGSVYVFVRSYDITSNSFQNMMVASYSARPKNKETWLEQARLLHKWYNGIGLCENDEISFIDYMIAKKESYYLADSPEWLKVVQPYSKVDRKKGISRAGKSVRNFLNTLLKEYMEEVIYTERDENGWIIKEVKGVSRILDPMLLEEIIADDGETNVDRVVAFQMCLAQAKKMNESLGSNTQASKGNPVFNALSMRSDKPNKNQGFFSKSRLSLFKQSRRLFSR